MVQFNEVLTTQLRESILQYLVERTQSTRGITPYANTWEVHFPALFGTAAAFAVSLRECDCCHGPQVDESIGMPRR